MKYRRNDEALREALASYTVAGTPVTAGVFGPSMIEEQRNMGFVHGSTSQFYYIVRADKPIPFQNWLYYKVPTNANKKLTLDEWKQRRGSVRFGEHTGLNLPNYLVEKLERGESLSPADVEFDDLVNRGCIDPDQHVTCNTFWPKDVQIAPKQLRKGQLVEYVYDGVVYPGAIAGFSDGKAGKICYLELFTPVAYLDAPDSIVSDEIEESFHSSYTYQLGYGVYEALELASRESGRDLVPEGKWNSDDPKAQRIYTLSNFMPLEIVKEVCGAYDPEEQKFCWWQSLILYILPIAMSSSIYHGAWRPLPEKTIPTEAVISYEDEDEG